MVTFLVFNSDADSCESSVAASAIQSNYSTKTKKVKLVLVFSLWLLELAGTGCCFRNDTSRFQQSPPTMCTCLRNYGERKLGIYALKLVGTGRVFYGCFQQVLRRFCNFQREKENLSLPTLEHACKGCKSRTALTSKFLDCSRFILLPEKKLLNSFCLRAFETCSERAVTSAVLHKFTQLERPRLRFIMSEILVELLNARRNMELSVNWLLHSFTASSIRLHNFVCCTFLKI